MFIEKPLSNSLENVDQLLDVCRERALTLMVGYNFRFYKPFGIIHRALSEERIGRPLCLRAEVGQYLPDWRPGIDYRQSVSASRELGGGVVLELSHELDYVRWLLGEVKTVSAQLGQLGGLQMDVEDTAEILLEFDNGALGSIHMDMVQRAPVRTCRISGTEGTITWDWDGHRVRLFSANTSSWQDLCAEPNLDRNEMYVSELRHFLDCVRGHKPPQVDGGEGRRVLEIIMAAKESSQTGRIVEI